MRYFKIEMPITPWDRSKGMWVYYTNNWLKDLRLLEKGFGALQKRLEGKIDSKTMTEARHPNSPLQSCFNSFRRSCPVEEWQSEEVEISDYDYQKMMIEEKYTRNTHCVNALAYKVRINPYGSLLSPGDMERRKKAELVELDKEFGKKKERVRSRVPRTELSLVQKELEQASQIAKDILLPRLSSWEEENSLD